MVVDQGKLDAFIGKAISEWGAAAGVLLVFLGDKLGLFKAMSGAGPGEARLKELITSAGFSTFHRAAQTPFNLILEARP